jgi:hypothetical protein
MLTGIPTPEEATQIPAHGSFRDGKAKLLQFRMDLGAPQCAFSFARRPLDSRTSWLILGRPPRGRDRHRQ